MGFRYGVELEVELAGLFEPPAGQIDLDDVQNEGASSGIPRADHTHAFPGPTGPPPELAAAGDAGASARPAAEDHTHAHTAAQHDTGGHADLTGIFAPTGHAHPALDGFDTQGLFSARPAAGNQGATFFATDQDRWYRDDGTDWHPIGGLVEVNVRDFGAVGDGVTDDRAAIQAAIGAVTPPAGAAGGVVVFPIGDYMVSSTINVPSGVTLRGERPGWPKQPTTGRSYLFMQTGVAATTIRNTEYSTGYNTNITIENLWIDGPDVAGGNAIHIAGLTSPASRIVIRGCMVRGLGGVGIFCQNMQESEVLNNFVSRCTGNALSLSNCYDNLVSGNQLDTYDADGAGGIGGDGIALSGVAGSNIITGNFVYLCNRGISVTDGRGNSIVGNRINDCQIGVLLQHATDATKVAENTIAGNVLYDNGYGGTTGQGILVDGVVAHNVITGNTVTDRRSGASRTQNYGIRTIAGTVANLITGNLVRNNRTSDIAEGGTNCVFGNTDGYSGFHITDGQPVRIGATNGSAIGQTTSKLAFFGATPIVKPSGMPAAATDLATVIALANQLRTVVLQLGLSS